MYLLGIDIGTSFIKLSLVDASTQKSVVTVQYPDTENAIISNFPLAQIVCCRFYLKKNLCKKKSELGYFSWKYTDIY